jgi:cyclic beta-1,2-glucan synthetase
MATPRLRQLIANAPTALCDILDESRGALDLPIRSEIFGPLRFAQHGRSLGQTHRAAKASSRTANFFPRLHSNISMLRQAQRYIGQQAATGYAISPAAEWLLDNFHLIEAQLKAIHEGLPRSYFRSLPMLLDAPLAGLPRVYGVAWAFVAHTDGAFDEDLLIQFLTAYQETRELTLSEMWALPTTLRVVLIENLRRLGERLATNKAAREAANLCCDHIDTYTLHALDELLAMLHRRGAGHVFLTQMAQRLQDRRAMGESGGHQTRYLAWVHNALPDVSAMQTQQNADQAADNLSVSNAVTSLRAIGDADWADIVASSSALMKRMLTSPVFKAEHTATRDQTLHSIESLARRSGHSEVDVAGTLLHLMASPNTEDSTQAVASHWLHGRGQTDLARALGMHDGMALIQRWAQRHLALPTYLGTLMGVTASLSIWVWHRYHVSMPAAHHAPLWLSLLGLALMTILISEAVVAVINRLISESVSPRHLPRLSLSQGIPPEHRVMVVIPALLTDMASASALVHRLHLHYLANPEPCAQFALLTDWADAHVQHQASDEPLLEHLRQEMAALNARHVQHAGHVTSIDETPRFIILHRHRLFSDTEQCWIGWERKRGKLAQLISALAEGHSKAFIHLGAMSRLASDVRYLVTLDSDTQLPPGRLRELVGIAAHPHNQPILDDSGRHLVHGYAIFQPRTVSPLPSQRGHTHYHWLFAGQCGMDPYSSTSSEVYQDLFGEGTFNGKGLLNVKAVHAVLSDRLPEGCVLSHDLLEGAMARCALVTDITLIEDAPFHADVAASRIHRWTRGDWQLLPFLLRAHHHHLNAINVWKMCDNLRRSLVAPSGVALVMLSLVGIGVSPWMALTLIVAALSSGPLCGALAGFWPSRYDLAKRHFYQQAGIELMRVLLGGAWLMGQLLQQAMMASDAIMRALFRILVSHRHLLQWTTAQASASGAQVGFSALLRQHWKEPACATVLLGCVLSVNASAMTPAWLICLVWATSPWGTWWASRPRSAAASSSLSPQDALYLEGLARDTWRYFERCVCTQDRHLPPDNLQTVPYEVVAHRTSPTNIGLYLLSTACARQFGWIGTQDLLTRMEATLASMHTLERHHGHFLNWYDTQTGEPLQPMYISTVDSGNLCGHLLAVAQSCRELAASPYETNSSERAITHSQTRLAPLLGKRAMLSQRARDELTWLLTDHRALVGSTHRDALAHTAETTTPDTQKGAARRLIDVANALEKLASEADFTLLYHPKRHLFHLGYRIAEQQLDAGFYDLLASEACLTGLVAIAKGDVPVKHWACLGRPFYAMGAQAGLRSWSGSMFEYLMPSLILDEPDGSVLRKACEVALQEHMAFTRKKGMPWGISESAYAGRDHALTYQYAPHGAPRLALRRTPPDELVIAPYATALASPISPRDAKLNFMALEDLGARGRYGFIDAIDYSPELQTHGEKYTLVHTFMAHHQGMCIVSLANTLLDGPAQRWGMAHVRMQAVSSLLHERPPREISKLYAPEAGIPALPPSERQPGMLRDVTPGVSAVEPTHLLSNGRYQVTLRANGAGWSRLGQTDITRWRDDVLRDAYGSFIFLRWSPKQAPVSVTQHPAPDPDADYQSTYHADRVCFDAMWPLWQTRTTVWVSPEDDIEFRQVEVRNQRDDTLDIDVISSFEVALSTASADEAHPAFSKLFVRATWKPAQQALLLERQPRLQTDQGAFAAHFVTDNGPHIVRVQALADRLKWAGRNQHVSQPLADFDASDMTDAVRKEHTIDTGLDPVCALCVTLRIAPHGKAMVTFATAASENSATLHAVMDKYRQHSHVERASLMSATLASIRLHALRMNAENFAAIQTLSTPLLMTVTRPHMQSRLLDNGKPVGMDRRLLWRLGIAGDRPIILVTASVMQGLSLMRALAQGLHLWSWGGVACDLIVLNTEASSYFMALHRELLALRDRYLSNLGEPSGATPPSNNGYHVLHTTDLSDDERLTVENLARIRIHADGRPLAHHVMEWLAAHETDAAHRADVATSTLHLPPNRGDPVTASKGTFDTRTGAFRFGVNAQTRPQRPWINVIANPTLGTHISEAGGGYTWAINSRLMQLTAWANDPVADPPAEMFVLQDCATLDTWSVTPSPWACNAHTTYTVTHGQGYTTISHRHRDMEVRVSWCVDTDTAVKQIAIELTNLSKHPVRIRVTGLIEWTMGSSRNERSSTHTALHRQRLPQNKLTALLCTQQAHHGGFGGGTAFLALADDEGDTQDWTCDRRECFDARGRWVLPDHFGQRSGQGLDPCAALSTRITLGAGETARRVFLLGYAVNPDAARQLAATAACMPAADRMAQSTQQWDARLNAVSVKTPDPLFDVMVNRWLLYQTLSCRLWAKAGLYQAGGASGFRDQLQDAMALSWSAPDLLRAQIVLCASRQFEPGDVQHWWHAPNGAGVRTHFSDDLLWLPYACAHYLRTTGDATLLDQLVPFLDGAAIPEGAEDVYDTPTPSMQHASVYEHAARTIDHSLRVGIHGLPLMGTGDWNDGMNRVGHEGRGESVWLGWFLCKLVADFAPVAMQRGDVDRAQNWMQCAQEWQAALHDAAWDGQWFKRAYFDDGQPLGSHTNTEGKIDLIAQAWSVLSGVAAPDLQRAAMTSVQRWLVDQDAGLIKLIDPPLVHAQPSAGYIQAYPPGVRENGGQYAHAGVWALMAMAELIKSQPDCGISPDTAYRYFTYLSPAHRASHPIYGPVYAIEPYVMAGDVYSQAPYVGRGGWSWYTGSAAWMHRAAIETIFGLQWQGDELRFSPCLPSHWQEAELTLRREGRSLHVIMSRSHAVDLLNPAHVDWVQGGRLTLRPDQPLSWRHLNTDAIYWLPLNAS